MAIMTLLSTLLLFVCIPSGNVFLLLTNMAAVGFAACPIINISYTYVVELTFPIKEPMSNGVMMMLQQISTTIISLVITKLIESNGKNGPIIALIVFTIMGSIALTALSFVKEDLRRLEHESDSSSEKMINDQ